jgi:hypothetical protein
VRVLSNRHMSETSRDDLVWASVPSGLQWCIFTTGVGAGCLQFIFLLMLMLEKPGWVDDSGRVRYISDALAIHQGFGAVLILLFLVSNCILGMSFVKYDLVRRCFFYMMLSLPISSGFGVVAYTNTDYLDEHLTSTMILFISYASVVGVVVFMPSGKWSDSFKIMDYVMAFLSILFTVMFVILYRMSDGKNSDNVIDNEHHSAAAIFEFLTISLFIMFNIMAPFRVRDHLRPQTK